LPLLIATTNPGKLREIRGILAGLPIEIVTPADFPDLPAPEETGRTFAENARLKALFYAGATGLPSAADDSGLEIDALDGAPGVHSARFNGGTYLERFRVIYERLAARGAFGSPARFVCAVALARGNAVEFETLATVEGRIAPAPRGEGGFGYDPIFYYPPYGRTLAEVSGEEKSAVSARGQAFRALRAHLAAATLDRAPR
jgi:XTP/dITP diphosphohydrolase